MDPSDTADKAYLTAKVKEVDPCAGEEDYSTRRFTEKATHYLKPQTDKENTEQHIFVNKKYEVVKRKTKRGFDKFMSEVGYP